MKTAIARPLMTGLPKTSAYKPPTTAIALEALIPQMRRNTRNVGQFGARALRRFCSQHCFQEGGWLQIRSEMYVPSHRKEGENHEAGQHDYFSSICLAERSENQWSKHITDQEQ